MANYESAWSNINNAGVSEYYVTPYEAWFSCDIINQNIDTLKKQIATWNERYASGNSKEKNNITKILDVQNGKLQAYDNAASSRCMINSTETASVVNNTATATASPDSSKPVVTNKKNYLLYGGIAAGVIVLSFIVYKLVKKG